MTPVRLPAGPGRPLAGARPGPGLDLTVSRPAPVGPLLMAGDKEFLPRLDLGRVAVDRLNGASDAAGVHRGQVMAIDGLDAVPAPAYRDKGELLPRLEHDRVAVDHVYVPPAAAHGRQPVPVAGHDAVVGTRGAVVDFDHGEGLPGAGVKAVGLDHVGSPPAAVDRRQIVPVEGLDGAGR